MQPGPKISLLAELAVQLLLLSEGGGGGGGGGGWSPWTAWLYIPFEGCDAV